MTTMKVYDYLNRLTQISSAPSAAYTLPQTFNYNYNPANQRTKDTLADGSYWVYGYDSLGQVTNGCKYFADGTPVAGQQFDYAFDTIGNRTQTQTGGDATGANLRVANFYANNLNQLTNRDVVPYVDITGASILTNAVTVNGQTAYRKEEYFRQELPVNNTNSALWTNIIVAGGQSVTGNVYVAQEPEKFKYDADGNLTNDGRWAYVWDAENRLIQMTVNTNVGPQYQLNFAYDAKGRRIQKVVATNGVAYSTNNFVYDGWNLAVTLNHQSSILASFTWGSDLSGSQQGAGGVGGLLWSQFYTNSLLQAASFYAYDGNGNVAALISVADGTLAANYEYGPFGELLRATGPITQANPIRFSTKYQDDESDLLYYGYRCYKASTGTWLSRDTIEERGGKNLYAFLRNRSIDKVDLWGLDDFTVVGKSFINGVGTLGRLGWRTGADLPGLNLPISVWPWFADVRLSMFARAVGGLEAFNQNPADDSEDGHYRLFARVTVHTQCNGNVMSASVGSVEKQGGQEFPGIYGTINATANLSVTTSSAILKFWIWGRPNLLVEPGMQWVALRTSVNIWQKSVIQFSCKCGTRLISYTGSRYPSRRLWINGGNPVMDIRQGAFSSLWQADPSNPTFVAP